MLREELAEYRDRIQADWMERILADYPEQTVGFLRGQLDPFANPVGAALREEVGVLLDGVLDPTFDLDRLGSALDRIIRVRALQDFAPSKAIGFVLDLKRVVATSLRDPLDSSDRSELDHRIDRLALMAFDVYSACREQVHEIRVQSIRNRSITVLERFNAWRDRRDAASGVDDEVPT